MEEWCSWSKVVLPKSINLISGFFKIRTWKQRVFFVNFAWMQAKFCFRHLNLFRPRFPVFALFSTWAGRVVFHIVAEGFLDYLSRQHLTLPPPFPPSLSPLPVIKEDIFWFEVSMGKSVLRIKINYNTWTKNWYLVRKNIWLTEWRKLTERQSS